MNRDSLQFQVAYRMNIQILIRCIAQGLLNPVTAT
jgi:hypothetical protein